MGVKLAAAVAGPDPPIFLIAGAVLERSALVVGFMAAAIAVGGFLGRAYAVLRRDDDDRVQRWTIAGGLWGLTVTIGLIVADQIAD